MTEEWNSTRMATLVSNFQKKEKGGAEERIRYKKKRNLMQDILQVLFELMT